jgi:hypothetical protein
LWYEEDPELLKDFSFMESGNKKQITLMPREEYKDNMMILSGMSVVVSFSKVVIDKAEHIT